jgi:uncharacterized OsmC-like protein
MREVASTAAAATVDNRNRHSRPAPESNIMTRMTPDTDGTHGALSAEQLKALQAPLKERYRAVPESALITLRARGRAGEGVSCNVETGRALVAAGLHPATGGDGSLACSGDMLLEALAACAGVTLRAVATAIGVDLRDAVVTAEGDLDFRGTLGVAKDAPVGFQRIRIHFDLVTSASEEQVATLIRLTERYCVVYQTLRQSPETKVSRTVEPSHAPAE